MEQDQKIKDKEIELQSTETVMLSTLTDREKMIYEAGQQDGLDGAGIFLTISLVVLFVLLMTMWGIHNHFKHGSFWNY